MKFVAISDTHCAEIPLPEGDVLLHAGDLTFRGDNREIAEAVWWLKKQREKFKHVIVIAGNHDWKAQRFPGAFADQLMEAGVQYLFDSGVVLDPDGRAYPWDPAKDMKGIKIWGSPWQPWFYDWAFNLKRGPQLKEKWDLIPAGTDILITHGPPYGILDRAPRGSAGDNFMNEDGTRDEMKFTFYSERVGCQDLWEAVKRVRPKFHVFGHIHADYGRVDNEPTTGCTFINASIMDERYDPEHKPLEFDLGTESGKDVGQAGQNPEAGGEPTPQP